MLSLTENTHRDKSLAGFSIYACGVPYVLMHSICPSDEMGFISYRIAAKRQYIEPERGESISSQRS